mmetsp:Transcript_811/g.2635  ORF Transcript_811/g.2635 Transcript_811/m.2635 type:complete len:227 (+) Transcript_811:264-944(+)
MPSNEVDPLTGRNFGELRGTPLPQDCRSDASGSAAVDCRNTHGLHGLHLSALRDDAGQPRFVVWAHGYIFDLANGQHAVDHPPKDDMFVVQPVADRAGDEKLAPVCARPAVGHGQKSRTAVLELKVLVLELGAVDRQLSRPIAVHEVAALDHEVLDDAVKRHALVSHGQPILPHLARAKLPKVLRRPRHDVRKQLHLDAALRLSADVDVEEHDRVVRIVVLHGIHL